MPFFSNVYFNTTGDSVCSSTSLEDQRPSLAEEPHKEYVEIESGARHFKPHINMDPSIIVVLLVVFVAVFVAFVCM